MKKITLIAGSALFVAYSAFGTGVSFTVEQNEIIVDGNSIEFSERATYGLTAEGFFVSDANFASFISDDVWSGLQSTSITEQNATDVYTFLNANGYASAVTITAPPIAVFPLFSGEAQSGGANNHAVLVIKGSFGGTDYLSVVSTTAVTADLGSLPVGFLSASSWDTNLLGVAGSSTLAAVVPEPSTFAALAGFLALGCVALRRRK